MIVLCVGMYRSCSTWQYGVASLLVERHRAGRRIGFVDGERFTANAVGDAAGSGWQVLKAHDAHPCFEPVLDRGQALGLFAYRDVRDVALSWMHMTNASFEDVTGRGFLDLCLANDRFWRSKPGVLVQTYEAIVAEPARAVAEIAAHLGIDLNDEGAHAIADAMSREANRRRIDSLNDRLRSEGTELVPQDLSLYDPNSLLHWNHIRDGRSGAWREAFSPDQCRTLAKVCGPWLIDRGYEADDAWAGGAVEPEPVVDAPRISFAANAEDIRLDRIFPDRGGSYLDLGALHPSRDNTTRFFHQRGWRGVSIAAPGASIERFRADRRDDLNLAVRLSDRDEPVRIDEAGVAPMPTRSVAGLIRQYRLTEPDIVAMSDPGDLAPILRGIPLDSWRPKVFAIACDDPTPAWETILVGQGYRFAADDGANRYYLRDDLASLAPAIQAPVTRHDRFDRAETVFYRDLCERVGVEKKTLQGALATMTEAHDVARREADHHHGMVVALIPARDLARREADHHYRLVLERTEERDLARREADHHHGMVVALIPARDLARREADHHCALAQQLQAEVAALGLLLAESQASAEAERDRSARVLAEAEARIGQLEADRDDLHSDCATWEAEASHRARLLADEQAARSHAEAGHVAERDRFAREKARFEQDRDRFERNRTDFAREAAGWVHERAHRDHQLAETQRMLRPYRLIDRLGVVPNVHRTARKLKRSRPS